MGRAAASPPTTANNGGVSANSLTNPFALTLDCSGDLYVADLLTTRVLFYPFGSTTATRVYGQVGSFTSNTANNGGISANSLSEPLVSRPGPERQSLCGRLLEQSGARIWKLRQRQRLPNGREHSCALQQHLTMSYYAATDHEFWRDPGSDPRRHGSRLRARQRRHLHRHRLRGQFLHGERQLRTARARIAHGRGAALRQQRQCAGDHTGFGIGPGTGDRFGPGVRPRWPAAEKAGRIGGGWGRRRLHRSLRGATISGGLTMFRSCTRWRSDHGRRLQPGLAAWPWMERAMLSWPITETARSWRLLPVALRAPCQRTGCSPRVWRWMERAISLHCGSRQQPGGEGFAGGAAFRPRCH